MDGGWQRLSVVNKIYKHMYNNRYKGYVLLLMCLLAVVPVRAQYLACSTDSGYAETPMLRGHFNMSHPTERVYAIVNSIGYHQLFLNGKPVGDRVMQPAVSQLDKHSLSVTYNIGPYLRDGENEIVLWLGQGWGRIYKMHAMAQAVVYRDAGYRIDTLLVTDSTWQASPSAYSYTGSWQPLQFGGERYDARVKPTWRPATVVRLEGMRVTPQEFAGNRIVDTVRLQSAERQADGSLLLDFGRVVTGWFEVVFTPMNSSNDDDMLTSLDSGAVVTMEYLDHLEAVPPHTETDTYISAGSGIDHFVNKFHTHSFRYVRIKGASVVGALALQISAVDPKEGATFECSDPRLNVVHDMVKYTLSCLTFGGYMVDCPHLERMGYGGDGNSSTMTLQTLYDVRDTYRNWLSAWGDAMDSTGSLPYVAPAFPTGGGPYWSGFIIKAPWRTYLNYGDRTLIDRHYEQMKRWLGYVERYSPEGLLQPWPDEGRMWFLGDWLASKGIDVKGEKGVYEMFPYKIRIAAETQEVFMNRKKLATFRPSFVAETVHAGQEKLNKAAFKPAPFLAELADAYEITCLRSGARIGSSQMLTKIYKNLALMARARKEYDMQAFAFDLARLYEAGPDEWIIPKTGHDTSFDVSCPVQNFRNPFLYP